MIRQSISKKIAQDIVEENFKNHTLHEPIKIIPDLENKLIKYYYRLPPGTVLDKSLIPTHGSFTDSRGYKFELLLIDVEIVIHSIVRTTYTYDDFSIESKDNISLIESKEFLNEFRNYRFDLQNHQGGSGNSSNSSDWNSSMHSPLSCIGLCLPPCKDCSSIGESSFPDETFGKI